jgi:hypothetical protein
METLFNVPTLSRNEKLKKSRKVTTDLTRLVIDYLNATRQFKVWRNNSIPSTRHEVVKEVINAFDAQGNPIEIVTEHVKVHFKKNQKTVSTLDIIGVRLWDACHTEIEIKTGKDKLDKEQAEHLADLQKAGCVSFVVTDEQSFLIQIEKFLKPKVLAF